MSFFSPNSCPLVMPRVATVVLSIWLRSTSDRVPTLRARSSFSESSSESSSVTALTTFGLVSSRLASWATASTSTFSSTVLLICSASSPRPLSCWALTITST
ncbi:hypothetical protein D9M68_433270 [compost metagenome]